MVWISPVIISQVIRIPLGHWTIGDEGTWIGFLGNYSGGILGGIIAFLVARDQVNKQRSQLLVQSLARELPVLTGIEIECEKVLIQLHEVNGNFNELWNNKKTYKISLDVLVWNRWEETHLINDPILQEELIKHHEALKKNIDVFGIDLNPLMEQLDKKKSQVRNMSPLDNRFIEFNQEISRESAYIEVIQNDKVHYLQEMKYCIEKTKKIFDKVKERRSKIHQILKKENFYGKGELISNPAEYRVDK